MTLRGTCSRAHVLDPHPAQLRFPDRTGENYSLQHSSNHKWYYYSRQVHSINTFSNGSAPLTQ